MPRPLIPLFLLLFANAALASAEPAVSAGDLAARLSAAQEGSSYVRLIMHIKNSAGAPAVTLQIQIKQRRDPGHTDVLYQILWPRERKGEAVLLHQSAGAPPSGSLLLPPATFRPLTAAQMSAPLFGSDLSYEDAIENFFSWPNQTLAGTEAVNRVDCVILESKPGAGDHSIYGSVRTWIDPHRLVPMRVEKYLPSGKLARHIDTTRIANDDNAHPIPANLTVHAGQSDSQTDLDGSRIRHDITYSDLDFSPDGLKAVAIPR